MTRLVAQAKVLARISGLAGLYKVDLDPLYQPLSLLGDELEERAMVIVPHTFDGVAILTRATRERVAAVIDPAQLRRLDRLLPAVNDLEIELEPAGSAVLTSVRGAQSRPMASVCGELEALGVGTLGRDEMHRWSQHLGGAPSMITDHQNADGSLRWTLHFRHANATDEERAETCSRLLAVADLLAVTKPQRSIIESLHGALAKQADTHALLAIAAEQPRPVLSVRWPRVRWETIIRMMLGFYPKLDAGKRLGELAGAFDAEHATAIELQFGTTEPPAMRVAVTT